MSKVKNFLELLESLSLFEINEIMNFIKEKYNFNFEIKENKVSDKEKSSFSIKLLEVGNNKIGLIKLIKDLKNLNLKDAKNFIEKLPVIIEENLNKKDMEKLKSDLEKLEAKLEIL